MDADRARKLLLAERERLTTVADTSTEAVRRPVSIPGVPVSERLGADAASSLFDREVDDSLAEHTGREMREIEDALTRLEEGTFGTCAVCGATIPDERLESRPATRYCVGHQAQAERDAARSRAPADPPSDRWPADDGQRGSAPRRDRP